MARVATGLALLDEQQCNPVWLGTKCRLEMCHRRNQAGDALFGITAKSANDLLQTAQGHT